MIKVTIPTTRCPKCQYTLGLDASLPTRVIYFTQFLSYKPPTDALPPRFRCPKCDTVVTRPGFSSDGQIFDYKWRGKVSILWLAILGISIIPFYMRMSAPFRLVALVVLLISATKVALSLVHKFGTKS